MSEVRVLSERLRLVPVVEFEPSQFTDVELPLPEGSSRENPSGWLEWWTARLAAGGIVGLEPVRPGSRYVPVANLTNPGHLRRLIESHLPFNEEPTDEDLSAPAFAFPGGHALCDGGEALIEPTCCVSLSDWRAWEGAARHRGADWSQVWIGHPWVSIRYQPPHLILSDYHEGSPPSDRYSLCPAALARAVDDARAELERFAARLAPVLTGLVPDAVRERVARSLAGFPS